jgi:tetraacyldisaccharide 4'-kinase
LAEAEYEAEQAAARAEEKKQAQVDAVASGGALPGKQETPENAMVLVKPELEIGPFPADSSAAAPSDPPTPVPPLVHLLDDGFQHRQLARDVDILLLNSHDWKDWLLPAGNLREPLEAARRADVIAIPADEPELEVALQMWGWEKPVWLLHRIMETPEVTGPVAAFCGIARPEQFFAGLESAGVEIAARFAFPDHFTYTHSALDELLTNAKTAGAETLITTEKDLARLGKQTEFLTKTMPLTTAHLRVKIEHQAEAIDWLIERLNAKQSPLSL